MVMQIRLIVVVATKDSLLRLTKIFHCFSGILSLMYLQRKFYTGGVYLRSLQVRASVGSPDIFVRQCCFSDIVLRR